MMVAFSQFESSIIEFPGTFPRLGTEAGPHALDALFVVRVKKHHNRIPLCIVQTVHCIWGDVQHCMFVLYEQKTTKKRYVIFVFVKF